MNLEQAKSIFFESREKENAIGLCFYLNSLDVETETAPRASMDYRSRQLGVLQSMIYDMNTSEDFCKAVRVMAEHADQLEPNLAHEIRNKSESMEKLAKIPRDEYLEYNDLMNKVYPIYVEAKQTDNFALFEEWLDKIFVYNRKYAAWIAEDGKEGYDVLLDEYERGYGRKEYDAFFDTLREKLVPFVKKVTEKTMEGLPAFAKKTYPISGQKAFCRYLQEVMCFDSDRTCILESEHPFTTNNGSHDVRITNHYHEDNCASAIFSAIHEMGHGLYELGIDDIHEGTGNSGGASLAIHESQSRLMENMIGRSAAFWETHFPRLQSIFPDQLHDVEWQDFYRYVNTVSCGLIRTEADELTYSLHVLIRYEIEKEVLSGTVEASDVPTVWNAKYKEYLGVEVPSDKEGCLQDVHWAGGLLGYFPTYALGSAYAAQIYHALGRDLDIDAAIRSGNVRAIADWLGEHLHKYGASKYPRELIRIATGEDFDPHYYVDYLIKKYSALYGIDD